eukprot:scaffold48745_cov41-Phaeocystis_antarctica.AAC.1
MKPTRQKLEAMMSDHPMDQALTPRGLSLSLSLSLSLGLSLGLSLTLTLSLERPSDGPGVSHALQ